LSRFLQLSGKNSAKTKSSILLTTGFTRRY
jgi:hypothetical protein